MSDSESPQRPVRNRLPQSASPSSGSAIDSNSDRERERIRRPLRVNTDSEDEFPPQLSLSRGDSANRRSPYPRPLSRGDPSNRRSPYPRPSSRGPQPSPPAMFHPSFPNPPLLSAEPIRTERQHSPPRASPVYSQNDRLSANPISPYFTRSQPFVPTRNNVAERILSPSSSSSSALPRNKLSVNRQQMLALVAAYQNNPELEEYDMELTGDQEIDVISSSSQASLDYIKKLLMDQDAAAEAVPWIQLEFIRRSRASGGDYASNQKVASSTDEPLDVSLEMMKKKENSIKHHRRQNRENLNRSHPVNEVKFNKKFTTRRDAIPPKKALTKLMKALDAQIQLETNAELDRLFTVLNNEYVKDGLTLLYQHSQSECSRHSKATADIGMSREKDLVAIFSLMIGASIKYDIDNSELEDFIIGEEKVSVKHSQAAIGTSVKAKWTAANDPAEEAIRSIIDKDDDDYPHLLISYIGIEEETVNIICISKTVYRIIIKALREAAFKKIPKNANTRGIDYERFTMELFIKYAYFNVVWEDVDLTHVIDSIISRKQKLVSLGVIPQSMIAITELTNHSSPTVDLPEEDDTEYEGSDEEDSDEEGSDEEDSDEEGSDEEGSDEEGSDEEGSDDERPQHGSAFGNSNRYKTDKRTIKEALAASLEGTVPPRRNYANLDEDLRRMEQQSSSAASSSAASIRRSLRNKK